jgi:hypothetical protein
LMDGADGQAINVVALDLVAQNCAP